MIVFKVGSIEMDGSAFVLSNDSHVWEAAMQKLRRSNEYALHISNVYAGGLIVVSLVFLQTMFSLGSFDRPAFISAVAFSIGLPLLAGILIMNAVESKYPYGFPRKGLSRGVQILFAVGILAILVEVGAALWHLSWIVSLTFIGALIVATIVYGFYILGLRRK